MLIHQIGMSTNFSSLVSLRALVFTSRPEYNNALISPTSTKGSPEEVEPEIPRFLSERIREVDPALPDIREMRKLARRLPKLRSITWTGRGGKGEWQFSRHTSAVKVNFVHAAVSTQDLWSKYQTPTPKYEFEEVSSTIPPLELPMTPLTPKTSRFPALSRSTTHSMTKDQGHTGLITTPRTPEFATPENFTVITTPKSPHGLGLGIVEKPKDRTPSRIPDVGRTASRARRDQATTAQLQSGDTKQRGKHMSSGSIGSCATPKSHENDQSTRSTGIRRVPSPLQLSGTSAPSLKPAAQTIKGSTVLADRNATVRVVPGAGYLQKNLRVTDEAIKAQTLTKASGKKIGQGDGWTVVDDAKRGAMGQGSNIAREKKKQQGRN